MSVYFIHVGRYFKIGASENPQQRHANLHKGGTRYTFPVDASLDPEDRVLYKTIDGWKETERAIHRALDDFAVGLEWFLDEQPVREFIDALPTEPPANFIRDLQFVPRAGGWCQTEYDRIQSGRADRELARYLGRAS